MALRNNLLKCAYEETLQHEKLKFSVQQNQGETLICNQNKMVSVNLLKIMCRNIDMPDFFADVRLPPDFLLIWR